MKIIVITHIDLNNNGYVPKEVFTFTERKTAVAKMKEIYEKAAKEAGIEDPYEEDSMDFCGEFPDTPFIPYAYCPNHWIDYFETDLN